MRVLVTRSNRPFSPSLHHSSNSEDTLFLSRSAESGMCRRSSEDKGQINLGQIKNIWNPLFYKTQRCQRGRGNEKERNRVKKINRILDNFPCSPCRTHAVDMRSGDMCGEGCLIVVCASITKHSIVSRTARISWKETMTQSTRIIISPLSAYNHYIISLSNIL